MKSPNRHGKGTPEWVGSLERGCWHAKVSIPGEGRKRVKLSKPDGSPLRDKENDRDLAMRLTADVSEAIREDRFRAEADRLAARLTVQQFGEKWTSGELYKKHGEVRRLKIKESVRDDRSRLAAHVYPHIGHKAVADVTEEDVERCLAKAARIAEERRGKPWRPATKLQVYQVLKRLFDLAIKPGRLRRDTPVSIDLRPARGKPKLYSFLYPNEFTTLLECTAVPLVRRVHYALAVYTGLRLGSLRALTWGGVDLVHGTLTSLKSKNDLPQIFEISPDLVRLLTRWAECRGQPPATAALVGDLECTAKKEAETLRNDLRAAGVTREILFSSADNVEALRFHDMRATFVTWARRAGRGRGWICDRTGHLTDKMMARYDRGARMLADLQYEPFPDLTEAIPELTEDLANVSRLSDFRHD